MSTIILASASPRRRELLACAQLTFSTMSVDIDETPFTDEQPIAYIERMVKSKSMAAIERLNGQLAAKINNTDTAHKDDLASALDTVIILTADTIGVLADGNTVLVKPIDRQHAYSMWQQMSDNTHQVWTAVQAVKAQFVYNAQGVQQWQTIAERQIIERTEVSFVSLTTAMMESYWDSGEPVDKAGGYGIQGLAAAWVTHVNGSYTNVVGLPLAQTLALINELKTS